MNLNELIRAVVEAPELVVIDANGNKQAVQHVQVRIGMCLFLISMRKMFTTDMLHTEIPGFSYHNGCLIWDRREIEQMQMLDTIDVVAILPEGNALYVH